MLCEEEVLKICVVRTTNIELNPWDVKENSFKTATFYYMNS